jgi:L-cysteine/cystine lyase
MTDAAAFRAEFPVLERVAYLNAGTEGPVPRRAAEAAHHRIDVEVNDGRCGRPYFDATIQLAGRARDGYAGVLGCDPTELALTGSTTDGVNTVLAGLDLRSGDEVITSDEEHPGLLAPLARARRRYGIAIKVVPFAELPGAVTSGTRLVACSHVSWASGRVMDVPALVATGVPVLLDAAQAIGAIAVDVHALGCDFYACSGQKWLCGPEGSGCLFVKPDRIEELLIPWPSYGSLVSGERPLELEPAEGAKRFDHGFPAGLRNAWALASLQVFEEAGWPWVYETAGTLAARLADRLRERGIEVVARDRTTLVSWRTEDPQAEMERLSAEGIVVRTIPAFGTMRASVGAWSTEEELERLVSLVAR